MEARWPGSRHRLERPASAADQRTYLHHAWVHQHHEAAQGVADWSSSEPGKSQRGEEGTRKMAGDASRWGKPGC